MDTKTTLLSDIERECIALAEKKERILAETSQLKVISNIILLFRRIRIISSFLYNQMELKHAEHLKNRLDENIQAAKTDRTELVRRIYSKFILQQALNLPFVLRKNCTLPNSLR